MKAWDEMVTVALIGTERLGFAPPAAEGALGEALRRVPGETCEARLLGCAALASAYARAGKALPEHADEPEPAPDEERQACSPEAERLLLRLLEEETGVFKSSSAQLLKECLGLIAQADRRIPQACLAALLEVGRRSKDLRPKILPLLGKRGAWLAGMNPEWAYASVTKKKDDLSAWENGTIPERVDDQQRLRTSDPAAARERLKKAWKKESVTGRTALLETLAINLRLEDEPFLEAALDDPRKEVRNLAADLLARLPDSRLSQRMVERIRPLVTLEKKLFGKDRLAVNPPEALDEGAKRDCIAERLSNNVLLGEKGNWLKQIMAATPLDYWTATFNLPLGDLIAMGIGTKWRRALIGGWAEAARRQRRADWIETLLTGSKAKDNEFEGASLLQALDPVQAEAFLGRFIQDRWGVDQIPYVAELFAACDAPLSPAATRLLIDKFIERFTCDYSFRTINFLLRIALQGHIGLYPEAKAKATPLAQADNPWASEYANFLILYEFRYSMHKELSR